MAYVQTPSSNRRTLAIGAVAALHAAAVYALITGFGATIVEQIEKRIPIIDFTPKPPPPAAPEPVPEPSQKVADPPPHAPKPPLDLNPGRNDALVVHLPPALPPVDPGYVVKEPPPFVQPSPTPSFAARAAMPLGSPGKWVSPDDYPASELRLEHEGVTRFRVTVGADGRVRNCEVTASSGFAELDRAACAKVARRARFKPATDGTGAAVSGSYSSAVKWEIPD